MCSLGACKGCDSLTLNKEFFKTDGKTQMTNPMQELEDAFSYKLLGDS